MNPIRVLKNPENVLILGYEPGLMIVCETSNIGDKTFPSLDGLEVESQVVACGRYLVTCGVATDGDDLLKGLKSFTGCDFTEDAIIGTLHLLGVEHQAPNIESALVSLVKRLLADRTPSSKTTLFCHRADATTSLAGCKTHFGFVLSGFAKVTLADTREYPLYEGTYFSISEEARIAGDAKIVFITQDNYFGYMSLGGRIPKRGHLKYIDGCTDSLLVPPMRLGNPCLNALFFPPNTDQTHHYHPSIRAGIVTDGSGECVSSGDELGLSAGQVFVIPADCWHSFRTGNSDSTKSALTVLAFHPDSDFGPTDEEHPMLNRTFTHFLHYLRSVARKPIAIESDATNIQDV